MENETKKTARKPRAAKVVATVGPRGGRIAPLQDRLLARLAKGSASVAALAVAFQCTERDVRLAIDRARVKGHAIKRLDKGVFGFETKR